MMTAMMRTLVATAVATAMLGSAHAQCVVGSEWSSHPVVPSAIQEVATAVVNNKMYVFLEITTLWHTSITHS